MTCQESYPVINLSLKSGRQPDFDMAYASLIDEIAKEYRRHFYVLQSELLTEDEKVRYKSLMERKGEKIENAKSLEFLSYCLAKCHQKNVIILIDEYDVPLENAHFQGFYVEMTGFIRSLFESALKTNPYLEFAVITGCLRISRESIFTGLNNLEIYNPWSILNYIKTAIVDRDVFPKPYWSNTSSNSIIREMVENADFEVKKELEALIAGESIEKAVHEDITYGDIHESTENLWNFLYFTGYLKKVGERQKEENIYLQLSIPNAEIRSLYRNTILSWFDKKIKRADITPLFKALEEGDCKALGDFLSEQLMETISFFDYAENYYHGFLAGLLKTSQKYYVYSNRESGLGRSDIILKAPSVRGGAVIMELKVTFEITKMQSACEEALKQIDEKNYEAGLRIEGYHNIKKYGVCFYRKECLVMKKED